MPSALVVLVALGFLVCSSALAYTSPGKPEGFVNDFAQMLSSYDKMGLEDNLKNFEKNTGHEIVVVTVPNLGDDTIENYAVELFKEWGIGKKGADNGVLFLIAKEDRKMRIEVGYGLEGALTDIQSAAILDQIVKPKFKEESYYQGIGLAVDEIEKAIKGEPLSVDVNYKSNAVKDGLRSIGEYIGVIIFFIVFGLFRGVFNVLGKTKSFWLGGVLGGVAGALIGGLLVGTMAATIGAAIILALLGLLFDYGASRRGWFKGKGGGGFWSGFFLGGGGGSSGGGFGGFGGGSSGGGGASSSW